MNVVALSMFSSSTGYLTRYFAQVEALRERLSRGGDCLRLILAEGDSRDDTYERLHRTVRSYWPDSILLKCDHGGEVYGSIEHPQRFAQLSRIWNEMIGHVKLHDDLALIVESDLIWQAGTVMDLLAYAQHRRAIVAPMVMQGPDYFYDCWAYRRDGVRFTNEPPYHPDIAAIAGDELLRLDSAGSCLAMPAATLHQGARTTEADELVGLCNKAGGAPSGPGYQVLLAPMLSVEHP